MSNWEERDDFPPLMIATNVGPHPVQPVVLTDELALHLMIGTDNSWTITQRANGWGLVSLHEPRAIAELVMRELAQFDWASIVGMMPTHPVPSRCMGAAGAALDRIHARYHTPERDEWKRIRAKEWAEMVSGEKHRGFRPSPYRVF